MDTSIDLKTRACTSPFLRPRSRNFGLTGSFSDAGKDRIYTLGQGSGEILELLELQFRELKLPNIQISQEILGHPREDESAVHFDESSASFLNQKTDELSGLNHGKRNFPVSHRLQSNQEDNGEHRRSDEVWRKQVELLECSVPSTLTTQANIRTARILAFLHGPKASKTLNGSNVSGLDHRQASLVREKEWNDLCESWEHSRGWIEHLMTTPKLIENTLVPELAKPEHKEKDVQKKELVCGRRADETWVPGQGWVRIKCSSSPDDKSVRIVKQSKARDIESRLSDRINLYRWSPDKVRDLNKRVSQYRETKRRLRRLSLKHPTHSGP